MRSAANTLVNMMLETKLVRACAHCEQEHGAVPLQPGQAKSHGICRRHAVESALALPPEHQGTLVESYQKAEDSMFCPDLKFDAREAQLAERLPSKQNVAGSYPVTCSNLQEAAPVIVMAVLTPESHKLLLERIPAKHATVYAHHVTLAYKPSPEVLAKYQPMAGERIQLPVTAEVSDDKGQAVLVGADSENEYPHCTISCAEGVRPVYSNELFDKVDWIHIPIFSIEAVVEIQPL